MSRTVRRLALAAVLALSAPLPFGAVRAGDEPAKPPAAGPGDLYDQTDRKKTMSIKLPRSWKALKPDEMDTKALAGWGGFYGEEGKSPNGVVYLFTANTFERAVLARAILLPQAGTVKADSLRQGPGWAEGCVTTDHKNAQWMRFVEKNNRVYEFIVLSGADAYDSVKDTVLKLLDSATVPGESTIIPPGDKFVPKKIGDFDVVTDAEPDRKANLERAIQQLGQSREIVEKALGGKPFDPSRPGVWLYQNGTKYEERVKASMGSEVQFGTFSGHDRVALVTILGDTVTGHDPAIFQTGAKHYVWQHFGGHTPFWIEVGLSQYGTQYALGGGKKLDPQNLSNVKAAVLMAKRRLDQWFDLTSWNDVTDNNQGNLELFAWHCYFREGKGAKKYKKQYAGYLQTLRDTGDPAAARKAFDGVNFDEMLQEFKSWVSEWKQ